MSFFFFSFYRQTHPIVEKITNITMSAVVKLFNSSDIVFFYFKISYQMDSIWPFTQFDSTFIKVYSEGPFK